MKNQQSMFDKFYKIDELYYDFFDIYKESGDKQN